MKKMSLVLILLIVLFTTGCEKNDLCKLYWDYNDNIVEFSYSYGGFHEGEYEYHITVNGDEVTYIANGYNGVDLNINKTIDKENIEKLEEVIKNNDIGKWNCYKETKDGVEDGYSFGIEIKYSDGSIIKARGSNQYPENYHKAKKEIIEVLKNIK